MESSETGLQLPYVHALGHLEALIPAKVQRGMATVDLGFSCLDATANFIAVGTSVGIAYLLDRRNGEIQKLRCEGPKSSAVTCVRCLETVELMVAVGMSTGAVAIFQIPLHWSSPNGNSNQMEKYVLDGLHSHATTYLEWSRNGMKLFSGDEDGVVAQTDVDFSMRLCKSAVLMKENHAVVQLVYEQRMLLVSTRHRTVLWTSDNRSKQLGQKERKSLGNFGACFCTLAERPGETLVLASRPALRLWKADLDGKVLETFIFKEGALRANQILSVNMAPPRSAEGQFGILRNFADGLVLTFNSTTLYLLAISEPTIAKRCDGLGAIASVAANADEIFVLSGARTVVRISCSPDHTVFQQNLVRDESFLPSLKFMPSAIRDLEYKLKGSSTVLTSSIFGMIKPVIAERDQQNSELDLRTHRPPAQAQAIEWPRPASGHAEVSEETAEAAQLWAPISDSEDDLDDSGLGVLFEQHVRKGHSGKMKNTIRHATSTADSSSADSSDPSFALEESQLPDCEAATAPHPISEPTIAAAPAPNSREEKEILLARMLGLMELLPEELQRPKPPEEENPFFPASFGAGPVSEDVVEFSHLEEVPAGEDAGGDPSSLPSNGSSIEFDIYRTNFSPCPDEEVEEVMDADADAPGQPGSECNSYLSYGPPSGSSNMNSMGSLGGRSLEAPLRPAALVKTLPRTTDADQGPSSAQSLQPGPEPKHNDFWVQHRPPGHVRSLAVCEHYIACTDARETVYYSSFRGMGLEWHRTEYLASQICISPSGQRVWRVHHGTAYALVEPSDQGPFGQHWVKVDPNVKHVSISDNCVWYVTQDGCVFAQTSMDSDPATAVPCAAKIAQVACAESGAWALTADNKLLCRLGVTEADPVGTEWVRVSFEAGTSVILTVALGVTGTVWVVDDALSVWFKSGLTPKFAPQGTDKKWWQVQIGDYVYQNISTLQNITSTLMDNFNPEQLASMLNRGVPCVVSTKPRGTWFYNAASHQLFTNQSDVIGHHWNRIAVAGGKSAPLAKWKVMTATGVYRHHGGIFMWQPGSSMLCFNPTSGRASPVKLPEGASGLQCLSASPESLWLLTKSGAVFIRKGITAIDAGGSDWERLELTQIANHKLVHISCGSNLVWACDNKGAVMMRIGSLQAPSVHNLQPAWVVVDDSVPGTAQPQPSAFAKVFVGPLDYTVWAIDGKNNVYVREGVFPELLIGLGWVPVSGIQATHLAISEHAVYALTPSKRIYRRYNISRNNYIGDYWMEMPGVAEQLSVTVDDKLWALNTRLQLMQHQEYVLSGSGRIAREKRPTSPSSEQLYSSCNDGDWELVDP